MGTLYYGDNLDILQLRTVKELMEGKGIERPSSVAATDETFQPAPEAKNNRGEPKDLGL